MAVAHSMLIAIYFVLLGNEFNDLGADYYIQFNREKKINSHVRQLSKLGVTIPDYIPRAAAPQPPDGQDLADTTSFQATLRSALDLLRSSVFCYNIFSR